MAHREVQLPVWECKQQIQNTELRTCCCLSCWNGMHLGLQTRTSKKMLQCGCRVQDTRWLLSALTHNLKVGKIFGSQTCLTSYRERKVANLLLTANQGVVTLGVCVSGLTLIVGLLEFRITRGKINIWVCLWEIIYSRIIKFGNPTLSGVLNWIKRGSDVSTASHGSPFPDRGCIVASCLSLLGLSCHGELHIMGA